MGFVAIDVETANPDMASICQIGIASYPEYELDGEWKSYVDPEDYFHPINMSIHGISPDIVRGAPTLPKVASILREQLSRKIVVCHTHFDRVAVQQAFTKYRIACPECTWLDSARVARRAWEECAWGGYGLAPVCEKLGYQFLHHDALEDAKAAGFIMISAMKATGISLEDWLLHIRQPIDPSAVGHGPTLRREGNPEGPFHGEVLVFTGALVIPRREAADLAAEIGFQVATGVTKKTTVLVVGDQDVKQLAGHTKSSKHRKAEKLGAEGQPLRIIRETDFKHLIEVAKTTSA